MAESNHKPISTDPDDAELSKLLDSALNDFGKTGQSSGAAASDPEQTPMGFDPEMAKQAAAEFQQMLKNLASVQQSWLQTDTAESGEPQSDPTSSAEESAILASFLQNLNLLTEKAAKVQEASSETEFASALDSFQSDDVYENELIPFMQGLVGNLLSKEMLYPSLKEISDKFPDWLEANKADLSPADLDRYERQLRLMTEAVGIFEAESDSDSDETKRKRFEQLVALMQQMQMCGHPPKDLVGDLPPGWELDSSSGLPAVVDSKAAGENCSLQ